MRGIVRPCRQHLGPELHARWQAHLCGLCLTLRDVAGQAERVLTGYDVLLLSVLVEAQAGEVETTTAAPCPLRGFTRATVVASTSDAGRLAAAGALVSAAAGLVDKLDDGDLPPPTRAPARRVAARLSRSGAALAAAVGLDPAPILRAPEAAGDVARRGSPDLTALLAPTGEAVAALFAHTAVVAGRPHNAAALGACGRAFGRLVHLLDAVEDRASDRAGGRFNPLDATGTDEPAARALADRLVAEVQQSLAGAELVDRALVDVLLGRELVRAVHRVLPPAPAVPAQRAGSSGLLAAGLAVWALAANAVFVGGSYGGGGCGGGRRRRRRYYDATGYGYPPRGYGYPRGYRYTSVGPSCGQLLACNCCANLACNACCCGSQCANS
jgi:hypothetical protein